MIRWRAPRLSEHNTETPNDDRIASVGDVRSDRGRNLRKPNIFVIGATKSGTTYLSKLLGAHPSIFICSPEGLGYFVDPEQLGAVWPAAWDLGFRGNEEVYFHLFRNAGNAAYLREASIN